MKTKNTILIHLLALIMVLGAVPAIPQDKPEISREAIVALEFRF